MRVESLTPANTVLVADAAGLLVEAFPHSWPDMRSATEEVAGCLAEGNVAFVAVAEGHAVGFIGGQPRYGTTGWELHPLVVSRKHQRSGVGTMLVAALEAAVVDRGGVMIYLGADDESGKTSLARCDLYEDLFERIARIRNLDAHAYEFYEKVGYRIVGVVPDANGIGKPDILMAKTLCHRRTGKATP